MPEPTVGEVIELVAAAHHHVKGAPYRYSHGWHPIDAADMKTWIIDQVKKDHASKGSADIPHAPITSSGDTAARLRANVKAATHHHPFTNPHIPAEAPAHTTPMHDKVTVGRIKPDLGASADSAIAGIDRVHHDGDMAPTSIQGGALDEGVAGMYTPWNGRGGAITLNPAEQQHPALTAAHEIGHYIDRQGLGNSPLSFGSDEASHSTYDSPMRRAYQAMRNSPTMTQNRWEAAKNPDLGPYVGYLTRPSEMFARAYSQYVATKSQSPELIHDLAVAHSLDTQDSVKQQWPDDEFAPIGAAIEAALDEKGWLNS